MKSFYSILKLSPNIATQDSVAVGVILFDGKNLLQYFSDKKLKFAKKIISNSSVDFDFIINQIKENLQIHNSQNDKTKLFNQSDEFSNPSFFDYLNKYSNGLLQFSKPKFMFNDENSFDFENLVNHLFNESLYKEAIKLDDNFIRFKELINTKLISKVEKQVHVNYKLSPKLFPSIYFNYEMDCLGLNGSLIGAKSLTFDKTLQVIDKDISHYFTLISNLSNTYNKSLKENDFYLISEEPQNIDSKEHILWESINNNDLLKVIHPEESDKIANVIVEKKASKFLD